jgi:Subtilase family
VDVARTSLAPGDVMLLEQQYPGITGTGTFGADDYVPSEYWPAVYDAIRLATQEGIIVVEAAGNSGVDTDNPAYEQPFPRGEADSGAIIVGAGAGEPSAPCTGTRNSRLSFSTYGTRVDLQGWGQCVTTTGYGTLYNTGGPNFFYRSTFNGTSSASPIVAAAAALYSSVFQATTGGRAPTPLAVRKRLIDTGTPQAASPAGHIGPLPNVAAATTGFDFTPPTVSFSAGPAGPTNDTTPTFAFAPSEAGSALECRVDDGAFAACASPSTTPALLDGVHTFEVEATDAALNPGEATLRAFTVDTVAPGATITDGPPATTTTATPAFSFSASEPGATFACRAGTPLAPGAFVGCISPHTTAALADGASVFEVRATDPAGNTGPAASRSFTVAVPVPPPAPVTPPPAPPVTPPPPPELAAPAAPAPPPAPVVAQAPAIGPGAKLTVSVAAGGFVRLPRPRITCPSPAPGCSVTATARLAGGAKSRIGSSTATIAAGKSATIRFRLTSSARARLRRNATVKATVAIVAKHGSASARRTVQLTLKRQR